MTLDKFRETFITWDKASKKVYQPLRVSGSDEKGRKIVVQVVNDGVVEDLTGVMFSLYWKTRKGVDGLDPFTVKNAKEGIFELFYTNRMLQNVGVLMGSFVLVDATGRIVSEEFNITVTGKIDDSAAGSQAELSLLSQALSKVSGFEAKLNVKADKSEVFSKTDRLNPENLSDKTLALVTGTGTVNLLSVPMDNSVTYDKMATGAGAYQTAIYLNKHDYVISKKATDLIVKFTSGTALYYRNVGKTANISPIQLEYTIPQNHALVLNPKIIDNLQVKSITQLTPDDNILVLSNGLYDAKSNLPSRQSNLDTLVYANGSVYATVVAGVVEVDFTTATKIYIRSGSSQNRELLLESKKYSLAHGNALVWNLYQEKIEQKPFTSVFSDDVILLGNYSGKIIIDNIQAGGGSSRIYTDDIIYYAGTVSVKTIDSSIFVIFSDQTDKRLFYRNGEGDKTIVLTNLEYVVPHNHSLVLNMKSKMLEVINTNDFSRGTHWLILLNHFGIAKQTGIKINETNMYSGKEALPRVPVNIKKRHISQDGCLVEDEIWLLEESDIGHLNPEVIYRLDKHTLEELGTIPHTLGHGNSVDYRNGKLLVISGAPHSEICLYENPTSKNALNFTDPENTIITFKEGENKTFKFDRTVVFGEDEKTLYFVNREGVCKVALGMGDNDLSDKTTDKSDGKKWGSFIAGRSDSQYNGTAQVLMTYTGYVFGATQCATYDGHLYVMNGFEDLKAYKLRLDEKSKTYEVEDTYHFVDTDYKFHKNKWEPESIFFINSTLYLTGRNLSHEGIMVGLNK